MQKLHTLLSSVAALLALATTTSSALAGGDEPGVASPGTPLGTPLGIPAGEPGGPGLVLLSRKVLTATFEGAGVIDNGAVIVLDGRIEAVLSQRARAPVREHLRERARRRIHLNETRLGLL